jgi:hypothetical protein
MTTHMQRAYEVKPDLVADLREHPTPANPPEVTSHRHVAVITPTGTEVWLDISAFDDHECIDIRQFNADGKMKGQGVFTIVNGMRGSIERELPDTAGKPVTGHRWNGGYVITLLVDKDGEESSVRDANSAGNG